MTQEKLNSTNNHSSEPRVQRRKPKLGEGKPACLHYTADSRRPQSYPWLAARCSQVREFDVSFPSPAPTPPTLTSCSAGSSSLCSSWSHFFSAPGFLFLCRLSSMESLPQPFPSLALSSTPFLFPESWNLKLRGYGLQQPLLMLSVADVQKPQPRMTVSGSLEITWSDTLISTAPVGENPRYLMLHYLTVIFLYIHLCPRYL